MLILKNVFNLLRSFSSKDLWSIYLLFTAILISSLMEIVAIGSIFPFIEAIENPDSFSIKYEKLHILYWFSYSPISNVVLNFTIIFIVIIIISNVMRIALLVLSIKAGFNLGTSINLRLFSKMLRRTYDQQILIDSSEVIANINNKAGMVIYNIILPALNILSVSVLLFLILSSFFILYPNAIALIISITFGIYYIISKCSDNIVGHWSQQINNLSTLIVRILNESFGNIRDVILYAQYKKYEEWFSHTDKSLRLAQSNLSILAAAPRYFLETIAIVILAIFAYIYKIDNQELVPTIGLFAFASQRMLPLFQQCYSSYSSIKGAQFVLIDINNILGERDNCHLYNSDNSATSYINIVDEVSLNSISYRYPEDKHYTLNEVSANFKVGSLTAITGVSGSGKSTLLDIICGLKRPSFGTIIIDSNLVSADNCLPWGHQVAYVSQDPYIFNGSLRRNIAQSLPNEFVNEDLLISATQSALLYDWIISLPDGFDTIIGERGIDISGGQRQRISIARALYRRATLLCLDESSNSLDEKTELELFEVLKKIKTSMIIIVVTHKTSSFSQFDRVYILSDGKLDIL